jgi:hypothetical protein
VKEGGEGGKRKEEKEEKEGSGEGEDRKAASNDGRKG